MFGTPYASWELMAEGVSTIVYRITHDSTYYYLRILPEDGATFAPEAEAHRRALALGCRVPEVLRYEARNELLGRSLMLTSEINGRPLAADDSPAVVAAALREAGRDLARINSIPVEGFGWVRRAMTGMPDRLMAEHATLDAMLDSEYARLIDDLPAGAVPGISQDELRRAVREAIELLDAGSESRLAHGDFDTSHIFVQRGRYAGIIDFGEIRGMPQLYDLGHHRMHDRERLPHSTLTWLIEGYGAIIPLPATADEQIAAWSLLIAVRALIRGLRHDPDSQIVATARRAIRRELQAVS